ncbi:MAG: multiheme c-type cytochrome, partial [Alphaproteobacteria bacterium]
ISLVLVFGFLEPISATAQGTAAQEPSYAGSTACVSCHQSAYDAWRGSHHSWALREPSAENVLADFDADDFAHKNVVTRFSKRDGKYVIETDGKDGEPTEFEIKYVVGVEPLQQYLVALENGRLQALDVVWDTERKRWYHLYPEQSLKAGDGLHWSGPYKNWNARCAECHTTGYEKNYDAATKSYTSRQDEIGVGCEACHGPAQAHRDWARSPEAFDKTRWSGIDDRGLTVDFAAGNAETEIQQCAGCHARREPIGASSPPPGTKFADNYRLALLRDGLYHADGQILDEVYVYGSFLQSKMSAAGVTCTNCHEPHSNRLKAEGNAVCTQCHSSQGNLNFPSLKLAFYDGPAHHFHETGTEGAQCASCHMPERLYMVVDGRNDHSFRVPRPDLTVKIGTPNTCTACHTDQTAAWAADQISRRYPNGRAGTTHYGELFSAARSGIGAELEGRLLALAKDLAEAPIVRATAIDLLRTTPSRTTADAGEPFLEDENPSVRAAAVALQQRAPPTDRVQRVVPLLEDSARSVRIAAARALIDITNVRYPPEISRQVRSAMAEYQTSLMAKTDFPEIQMVIGGIALTLRNSQMAESAFSEAVNMDPQLADGWLILARLQLSRRDVAGAEQTLERAVRVAPREALLYHSLGGVKIMAGKRQEAVFPLERAYRLMPNNTEIMSDLGLLLSQLSQHERAIPVLKRARIAGNRRPEILSALFDSLVATNNRAEAQRVARDIEQLYPGHPAIERARQLFAQ